MPEHAGMGETPPAQLPGPHSAIGAEREPPSLERGDHLIGGPAGAERREHVGDRGGDFCVRVDDREAVVVVDEPDREMEAELAPLGRGPFRTVEPPHQEAQFRLAHRSLQAQQEAVVEVRQVVDAIGVDHQRVGQSGQLQQTRQVRRRAGQAGHLEAEDGPDLAQADPADQILEPAAVVGRAPRQTQVGVDHLDP